MTKMMKILVVEEVERIRYLMILPNVRFTLSERLLYGLVVAQFFFAKKAYRLLLATRNLEKYAFNISLN